jgi:hypothetical protein
MSENLSLFKLHQKSLQKFFSLLFTIFLEGYRNINSIYIVSKGTKERELILKDLW